MLDDWSDEYEVLLTGALLLVLDGRFELAPERRGRHPDLKNLHLLAFNFLPLLEFVLGHFANLLIFGYLHLFTGSKMP